MSACWRGEREEERKEEKKKKTFGGKKVFPRSVQEWNGGEMLHLARYLDKNVAQRETNSISQCLAASLERMTRRSETKLNGNEIRVSSS